MPDATTSRSVLVTGPRGLLGSTLLRVLADAGWNAIPFEGDITNAEHVARHLPLIREGDWVVHAAAATDVNRCERERDWCFRVNAEGTRAIRDLAAARGARLLFISTVSVFSGERGDYGEDAVPAPTNAYNESKAEGEKIVLAYPEGFVLRLNLIGIHPSGSRGKNFLEWLYDSARGNKDVRLFSDVRINPLSNWTIASLIGRILSRPPAHRILHIGSRDVRSKADIGKLVLARVPSYTGTATVTTSDQAPSAVSRPKEMWLNTDRTVSELGIPMTSVEEELETIFRHLAS